MRALRSRPVLLFDLPMLVLVIACWMTVAVWFAHVATGIALIVMAVAHLCTRKLTVGKKPIWWVLLVAGGLAMSVTGVLRMVGVPPLYANHALGSYLFLTVVVVHLVFIRRILTGRIRNQLIRGGSARNA